MGGSLVMATVTWTPSQWGSATGGVFTTGVLMNLDAAGTVTGGAIFDATAAQTLRTATVGGQVKLLDGPILTALSLVIVMNRPIGSTGPATMEVGLVPEATPADYSNALLPWARSEVSLGTFTIDAIGQPLTQAITTTLSLGALEALRSYTTSRSNWSGKLALSFRANNATITANIRLFHPGPQGDLAQAVTTQAAFFSGLVSTVGGGRRRVVRDHRYAMPAMNSELVRDGDQPGLWVRPWDADPEDEPNTYRPRPGEGTVDDPIGDL